MLKINSSSPTEINQLRAELTEFQLVDTLRKIKMGVEEAPSCFISYAKGIIEHETTIHKLAEHLREAGLQVNIDIWDRKPGTRNSAFIERLDKSDYIILAGSKNLKEQYDSYKDGRKEEGKRVSFDYQSAIYVQLEQVFNKLQERSEKIIPLLLEGEMATSFPAFLQGITPLNMQVGSERYPYQAFELIERLIGEDLSLFVKEFKELQLFLRSEEISFDELLKIKEEAEEKGRALTEKEVARIINGYKTQLLRSYAERESHHTLSTWESKNDKIDLKDDYLQESVTFYQRLISLPKKRKIQLLIANIFCLSFVILFLTWADREEHIIRPKLVIPDESVFLNRPALIGRMKDQLEAKEDIQTIALVGIGGAGKSTIAHYYAKLHPSPIIEVIKADTKENLIKSFKMLAKKLVKTKEDKDNLDLIQQNRNPDQEEEQLIDFIKIHLRKYSNWLLIYDDVLLFPDIVDFFPDDPAAWGQGRIIITTQDENIGSVLSLKPENVIPMQELSPQESLTLFSKILFEREPNQLPKEDKEEITSFLTNIPPFPLDIFTVAGYAKTSGFDPKKLEKIIKYRKNSKEEKAHLSKKILDYREARYELVTIPFKTLINEHADFKKLLLFICMSDSQDIPLAILEYYEEKGVIDNFIDTLKKYFLITTKIHNENGKKILTLSIHPSFQSIGLNFLLDVLDKTERSNLLNELAVKTAEFCDGSTEHPFEVISLSLLLPHLEAFVKNIGGPPISEGIEMKNKQKLFAALGCTYYWYTNNFLMAKEYFIKSIQLDVLNDFILNKDLAEILCSLAALCADLENLDEALHYAHESMEKCKNMPAVEVLLARNQFTIASVYVYKNNFGEAKRALQITLDQLTKVKEVEIRKEFESKAYAYLGWLYSETFLTHDPQHNAEKYVNMSLKALDENPSIQTVWNERKIKSKINSGEVYCRLGRYKEAEEAFKEAQEIIDGFKDGNPYNFHTIRILVGMGEILLREGNLGAAYVKLTEALTKSEKVVGPNNSWIPLPARVFRVETLIRQEKLAEAYEDCDTILKMDRKAYTNYVSLLYLITDYHAAIIKYKQNDLERSIEHFSEFFKQMRNLCKRLLDKNAYENLEKESIFKEPIYQKDTASSVVQNCLDLSAKILTVIYGPSHPFITNYIQVKNNIFLNLFPKWTL